MEYCKNCYYSLEITRNTKREEGNIKSVNKPEELVKLKIADGQQYIINFNEGVLKDYVIDNNLDKEAEVALYKKFKTLLKQQKNAAQFIFACSNCGSSYVIQPGTVLYNINFDSKNKVMDDDDIENKCLDPILARTKDYICPNKSCVTHKKDADKEAVFIRQGTGFNLKYICCVCKTQWNV